MIAILLYLIGLISVVVTIVLVGFDAPTIYYSLLAAYNEGVAWAGQRRPSTGPSIRSSVGWS